MKGAKTSFSVGSRVIATGKVGVVRFIGATEFAAGEWVGIVLDEPLGKNDGSVAGVRYFQCTSNYGLFVKSIQVKLVAEETLPDPQISVQAPITLMTPISSVPVKPAAIEPITEIIPQVISPVVVATQTIIPVQQPESKTESSENASVVDLLAKLEQQYEVERILRDDIDNFRREKAKSDQDLARLKLLHSQASAAHEQSCLKHKSDNDSLSSQLRTSESTIVEVNMRNSNLLIELQDMHSTTSQHSLQIAEKTKRIQELDDLISEQTDTIELLTLDNEQLMIEQEEMKVKSSGEIVATTDDPSDDRLKKVIAVLHSQLMIANKSLDDVRHENNHLKLIFDELNEYKSNTEEELVELRDIVETGREFEVIIEKLTNDCIAHQEEIEQLKICKSDLEAMIDVSEDIETCLKGEVSDLKNTVGSLEVEVANKSTELKGKLEDVVTLNTTISGLKSRLLDMEGQFDEFRHDIDIQQSNLESNLALKENLMSTSSQIKSEMVNIRRMICVGAMDRDGRKCSDVISSLVKSQLLMIDDFHCMSLMIQIYDTMNRIRYMKEDHDYMSFEGSDDGLDCLFNIIVIALIKTSCLTSSVSFHDNYQNKVSAFIAVYASVQPVMTRLLDVLLLIESELLEMGQVSNISNLSNIITDLWQSYVGPVFPSVAVDVMVCRALKKAVDYSHVKIDLLTLFHDYSSDNTVFIGVSKWLEYTLILMNCRSLIVSNNSSEVKLNLSNIIKSLPSSKDIYDIIAGNTCLMMIDLNGETRSVLSDDDSLNERIEQLSSSSDCYVTSPLPSSLSTAIASSSSTCQLHVKNVQRLLSEGSSCLSRFKDIEQKSIDMEHQLKEKLTEIEDMKRQLMSVESITKRFFEMSRELADMQDKLSISETEKLLFEEAHAAMERKLASTPNVTITSNDVVRCQQLSTLLSSSLLESDCLRRSLICSLPQANHHQGREEKAVIRAKLDNINKVMHNLHMNLASQSNIGQSRHHLKSLVEAYSNKTVF